MRSGPSFESASWSMAAVMSGSMVRVDWARMAPASMCLSMVMTELPVMRSPATMAALMGEAPRHLGRRLAWRLMAKRSAMSFWPRYCP